MEKVHIREKLHDFIDQADDRILNLIYAMMIADMEKSELEDEIKKTLDKRIASHKENPLAGSSWEDVKGRFNKQL